jgi:exosortase H (IPTLxxWG-CTERM-specific)
VPPTPPPEPPSAAGDSGEKPGWKRRFAANRQEIQFLAVFLGLLFAGFAVLSLNGVNDRVVEPFTGWVARTSGSLLKAIGQNVSMQGTIIQSPDFAVNIRNGCNGVETLVIFCAAVLAFPASWRSRLWGLVLGVLAIQAINFIRVIALFLTGAYYPKWFDSSHTVVWQTVVILCGVLLWMFWASKFAERPDVEATPTAEA